VGIGIRERLADWLWRIPGPPPAISITAKHQESQLPLNCCQSRGYAGVGWNLVIRRNHWRIEADPSDPSEYLSN
jgi:hypothetical protein